MAVATLSTKTQSHRARRSASQYFKRGDRGGQHGIVALVHLQGAHLSGDYSASIRGSFRLGTGTNRVTEQRFLIESDLAIGKMSLGMTAEPSGNVDSDFVAMITAHQQGAIDVADAELKYGHNEVLRHLARDMIAARAHEISVMHNAVEELAPAHTSDIPKAKPSSGPAPSAKGNEK
jgi:hypothetical protein